MVDVARETEPPLVGPDSKPRPDECEDYMDSTAARPILIFDGDCGFCTWSAGWVADHAAVNVEVVPWQRIGADRLEMFGLTEEQASASAWWVDESGECFGAQEAIGNALSACRIPWQVIGFAMNVPPGRWLSRVLYPVIARHRHRLPGGTPACRIGPTSSSSGSAIPNAD
jgi:predicted DCC family thiol-disulfide oxidoreductase YuxK